MSCPNEAIDPIIMFLSLLCAGFLGFVFGRLLEFYDGHS